MALPKLLTAEELVEPLKLGLPAVYELIKVMPQNIVVRFGKKIRINEEELAKWILSGGTGPFLGPASDEDKENTPIAVPQEVCSKCVKHPCFCATREKLLKLFPEDGNDARIRNSITRLICRPDWGPFTLNSLEQIHYATDAQILKVPNLGVGALSRIREVFPYKGDANG